MNLVKKIHQAIQKLNLNLNGKSVLTEAATGNYVVTPIIAASAGADVIAYTKNSAYGSVEDVVRQTTLLAGEMGLNNRIKIVTDLAVVDFSGFDIVTNCGFLRPLNRDFIERLSPSCVIPLMYEPWEFRDGEIDLGSCREKGIKVYGTNEADPRLRIMDYIGFTVLYWLLEKKLSPLSAQVLVLGCRHFADAIEKVLNWNGYRCQTLTSYESAPDPRGFDAIVVAEWNDDRVLVGRAESAFINVKDIPPHMHLIHISGKVELGGATFTWTPENPRPYRTMSYTTDFIDPQAVVDLHAAGLKVGEGMLKANQNGLAGAERKAFLESQYPALAFQNQADW